LERLAAYNPAARLILMLRDPVERAWSHWRMEHGRGVETHPFGWCVRQGRQRLFNAQPWGVHREFSYVERGFYGAQAERLFSLFPPDQVLVLRAEDLLADPDALLSRVADFLGTPQRGPVAPLRSHVGAASAGLDAADVAHLRRVYARDQDRLRSLTGLGY